MYDKKTYREYFIKVSSYVTWISVCNNLKIDIDNFRKFKLGTDRCLSQKKCQLIVDFLTTKFEEVADDVFVKGETYE